MARRYDYPIIRFLIGAFYLLAAVALVGGLGAGLYLWIRAEALRDGILLAGPLSGTLAGYDSTQLYLGAAVAAGGGFIAFILLGACGQLLAMQRDRAVHAAQQVELLEDILDLNEDAVRSAAESRIARCEGCGRPASLARIESGQWVCLNCRRQIRSAS